MKTRAALAVLGSVPLIAYSQPPRSAYERDLPPPMQYRPPVAVASSGEGTTAPIPASSARVPQATGTSASATDGRNSFNAGIGWLEVDAAVWRQLGRPSQERLMRDLSKLLDERQLAADVTVYDFEQGRDELADLKDGKITFPATTAGASSPQSVTSPAPVALAIMLRDAAQKQCPELLLALIAECERTGNQALLPTYDSGGWRKWAQAEHCKPYPHAGAASSTAAEANPATAIPPAGYGNVGRSIIGYDRAERTLLVNHAMWDGEAFQSRALSLKWYSQQQVIAGMQPMVTAKGSDGKTLGVVDIKGDVALFDDAVRGMRIYTVTGSQVTQTGFFDIGKLVDDINSGRR